MEAFKHATDVRVVVDAHHRLAFAAAHELSQPLIVLKRKVDAITSGLPVRRVHVVERVRTVVAFSTSSWEIFNVGARQALPSGREAFLDSQQVNGGAMVAVPNGRPAGDVAREGMVLQVKESSGARIL